MDQVDFYQLLLILIYCEAIFELKLQGIFLHLFRLFIHIIHSLFFLKEDIQ